MTATAIDWTNVLTAFVVGLPALIGAIASMRIHSQIKTPSKTSIGKQVENALQTALANNYRLRSLGGEVEPPTPIARRAEAARANEANGGNGDPSTEGEAA